MRRAETAPVTLAPLEFEICTLAPVRDGFAVIGLTDIFNSGGCVAAIRRDGPRVEVGLRDGGEFLAWSARAPQAIRVNGHPHAYTYDADSSALRIRIPRGQAVTVAVE
jgi:YD repeat-containing protein